jgi:hypothetical protein
MSTSDQLAFSLPPLQLFGLIAPNFQGYAEWVVYPGAVIVIALLWTLISRSALGRSKLWLGMLVISLMLALADAFPLYSWLARLPGWDLLRVPSRFMIVFGFSACVIFARFISGEFSEITVRARFWGNLATFGISIFCWVIAGGTWLITGSVVFPYLWGALALSTATLLYMGWQRAWLSSLAFRGACLMLVIIDLGAVSYSEFTYRGAETVLKEGAEAAAIINETSQKFRFYSPSYSIPQQTSTQMRLEAVNGIDPMQLRSLTEFLTPAVGINLASYSVTIPPFESGNIQGSNQDAQLDSKLLGQLNVKFVAADYAIQNHGLIEIKRVGPTYIYQNLNWMPRARVQKTSDDSQNWGIASILHYSPNQIDLKADGEGELVLSEMAYSGWQVWVDGTESAIQTENIFRSTRLATGTHEISFIFRPVSLTVGLSLAVVAWAWLANAWLAGKRKHDID